MYTRQMLATVLLVVIGCLSSVAHAKPQSCSLGELTRNVSVIYNDPGQPVPCEVWYEKPTEGVQAETLWQANNEAGYCEARAAEFVDKLTNLGWACNSNSPTVADTAQPAVEEEAE
ncbi:MAG: hypothetical protein AAF513_12385 [Pseudomonadota bacterium]